MYADSGLQSLNNAATGNIQIVITALFVVNAFFKRFSVEFVLWLGRDVCFILINSESVL